jgi:hypothetical protein
MASCLNNFLIPMIEGCPPKPNAILFTRIVSSFCDAQLVKKIFEEVLFIADKSWKQNGAEERNLAKKLGARTRTEDNFTNRIKVRVWPALDLVAATPEHGTVRNVASTLFYSFQV